MVGLDEFALFTEIEQGYYGAERPSIMVDDQSALNPNDALVKLTNGVVQAIAANNRRITEQLERAGVRI